jgi:tryptophanyl-tRNA synthetase
MPQRPPQLPAATASAGPEPAATASALSRIPSAVRRAELAADPATLDAILADGALRARAVALPTIERVRKAMGFGR